jgi:hypothetical protein
LPNQTASEWQAALDTAIGRFKGSRATIIPAGNAASFHLWKTKGFHRRQAEVRLRAVNGIELRHFVTTLSRGSFDSAYDRAI